MRTRAVVEHNIGVLKARWMCLDTVGGKLLYSPEKGCVLHNIAMNESFPLPEPAQVDNMPEYPPHGLPHQSAIMMRQQLIARLYLQSSSAWPWHFHIKPFLLYFGDIMTYR